MLLSMFFSYQKKQQPKSNEWRPDTVGLVPVREVKEFLEEVGTLLSLRPQVGCFFFFSFKVFWVPSKFFRLFYGCFCFFFCAFLGLLWFPWFSNVFVHVSIVSTVF